MRKKTKELIEKKKIKNPLIKGGLIHARDVKSIIDCELRELQLTIIRRNEEIQNLEDGELQRLYNWVMDPERAPAQTYFTAGMTRNVAKEIEYLITK